MGLLLCLSWHCNPHDLMSIFFFAISWNNTHFSWSIVNYCFIACWIHPVCSSEEGRTPCPNRKRSLLFSIDHCSIESWGCSPAYQMISLAVGVPAVKIYSCVSHVPLCNVNNAVQLPAGSAYRQRSLLTKAGSQVSKPEESMTSFFFSWFADLWGWKHPLGLRKSLRKSLRSKCEWEVLSAKSA